MQYATYRYTIWEQYVAIFGYSTIRDYFPTQLPVKNILFSSLGIRLSLTLLLTHSLAQSYSSYLLEQPFFWCPQKSNDSGCFEIFLHRRNGNTDKNIAMAKSGNLLVKTRLGDNARQ